MHIFYKNSNIFLVGIAIDMCIHISYNIDRTKHGSVEERQLLYTCAGEIATYTTDKSAPQD